MAERESPNILQELDDLVVLLSMLGLPTSPRTQKQINERELSPRDHQWCCVLDEFSFLGDYKNGGKTITSIAAQHTKEGAVFWVAGNHIVTQRTTGHLKWILRKLQTLKTGDQKQAEVLKAEIFRASVSFSHTKVKNYARMLRVWVQRSNTLSSQEDERSGELRLQ